jgi:hypothetical protein
VEGNRFGFFEGYILEFERIEYYKRSLISGFPAKNPTQDSPHTGQ